MNIVITGGTGFIGRRLTLALLRKGGLIGRDGTPQEIEKIVVCDVAEPQPALPDDPRLEIKVGDFSDADFLNRVVTEDTDAVFHLAAIVSGQAEEDFDLGMRINFKGTEQLLERLRGFGTRPRLVFASSVAVFGGDMPEVIEDRTHLNPQTSYGTQKAIAELLINDYSRKGFIDGRSLRLPTIIVRPGKPNAAASSFASGIIREPLRGAEAICPVSPDTHVWMLSPRRVVECFIRAEELPAEQWGPNRALALPGLTASVKDMVDAMRDVTTEAVTKRIRWEPDAFIEKIVYGWATHFEPKRALAMGFEPDNNVREIIEAFIEDDLDGKYAP